MRFWRSWLSMGILATATLMAQTKWHHRYAEVNGVKLHYVEQGKGDLILFLHGFPEFWYEWKDLHSVGADVGRPRVVVLGDLRNQVLPLVQEFRESMQKQDQVALALLHVMQLDAVHLGVAMMP